MCFFNCVFNVLLCIMSAFSYIAFFSGFFIVSFLVSFPFYYVHFHYVFFIMAIMMFFRMSTVNRWNLLMRTNHVRSVQLGVLCRVSEWGNCSCRQCSVWTESTVLPSALRVHLSDTQLPHGQASCALAERNCLSIQIQKEEVGQAVATS
jgi:hypothetical protein